jgi:hypothetical protein
LQLHRYATAGTPSDFGFMIFISVLFKRDDVRIATSARQV